MSRARRYRDHKRRGAARRGRSLFGQEMGYDAGTEAVDPFTADPTVEKPKSTFDALGPLPDSDARFERRIRNFVLHLAVVITLCPLPDVREMLWAAARQTPGYEEIIKKAKRGEPWKVAHENLSRSSSQSG